MMTTIYFSWKTLQDTGNRILQGFYQTGEINSALLARHEQLKVEHFQQFPVGPLYQHFYQQQLASFFRQQFELASLDTQDHDERQVQGFAR